MDRIDVDLKAMCLAAAGEGVANVSAHVSRSLLEAARTAWPRGWRSGASPAVESIVAFRWAVWCGCPWRGRVLMRAAARLGAIDVLRAVAPMYREWDSGATVAAATADRLDVILEFDPAPAAGLLYAAGPRVRAHFESTLRPLDTYVAPSPWFDPRHDFRPLLDGAVPIDTLVAPRDWSRLIPSDMKRLREELGVEHPTALARVRTRVPPLYWDIGGRYMIKLCLPQPWSIVYDIQPSVGVIRCVNCHGPAATVAFDPGRAWFVGASAYQGITMWIEVGLGIGSEFTDVEFTGAIVSQVAMLPFRRFATDEQICYVDEIIHAVYRLDDSPLERVDGSDDATLVV